MPDAPVCPHCRRSRRVEFVQRHVRLGHLGGTAFPSQAFALIPWDCWRCRDCDKDFHVRKAIRMPIRDLLNADAPEAEAKVLFEACITATVSFEEMLAAIPMNEAELSRFQMLIDVNVIPLGKAIEVVERRRRIARAFQKLVAAREEEANKQ